MTTKNLHTEIQAILLGYLEDHPNALNTTAGVQQWWLLRRVSQYSIDRVQRALDHLVKTGFIQAVVLDDGQSAYGLCGESGLCRESPIHEAMN
jgi:Fe2+ or Zn2+ uptake regulation protein